MGSITGIPNPNPNSEWPNGLELPSGKLITNETLREVINNWVQECLMEESYLEMLDVASGDLKEGVYDETEYDSTDVEFILSIIKPLVEKAVTLLKAQYDSIYKRCIENAEFHDPARTCKTCGGYIKTIDSSIAGFCSEKCKTSYKSVHCPSCHEIIDYLDLREVWKGELTRDYKVRVMLSRNPEELDYEFMGDQEPEGDDLVSEDFSCPKCKAVVAWEMDEAINLLNGAKE